MSSNDDHQNLLDPEQPQHGVAYPGPFAELLISLCASASRYLRILSPALDHTVFDNAELVDAISALARRDSHSQVHILISDSRPIIQHGHRLINVARRLPSSVVIRKLSQHPEMTGETVIVRDLTGVLYMPGDEGPGFYEPDSRAAAQHYIDKFELLWQRAVLDPEFRRLGL